jgi:hypothetical protein
MGELYHVTQLSLPFLSLIDHTSSDCTCTGKQCNQCQKVQCYGCFHRFVHSRDGYRAICKLCRKAERETEEFKAKRRERDHANADHINERKRMLYSVNPEKYRQESRDYRERNPEKVEASIKEYNRTRWQIRDTNRKQRIRSAGGHYTRQEWRNLKDFYNHTCLCCGKQEPEIKLTPDHVIPVAQLGTSDIGNIQPLCVKCNQMKATRVIDYRPVWNVDAC